MSIERVHGRVALANGEVLSEDAAIEICHDKTPWTATIKMRSGGRGLLDYRNLVLELADGRRCDALATYHSPIQETVFVVGEGSC